jgi:hypothetical protein
MSLEQVALDVDQTSQLLVDVIGAHQEGGKKRSRDAGDAPDAHAKKMRAMVGKLEARLLRLAQWADQPMDEASLQKQYKDMMSSLDRAAAQQVRCELLGSSFWITQGGPSCSQGGAAGGSGKMDRAARAAMRARNSGSEVRTREWGLPREQRR